MPQSPLPLVLKWARGLGRVQKPVGGVCVLRWASHCFQWGAVGTHWSQRWSLLWVVSVRRAGVWELKGSPLRNLGDRRRYQTTMHMNARTLRLHLPLINTNSDNSYHVLSSCSGSGIYSRVLHSFYLLTPGTKLGAGCRCRHWGPKVNHLPKITLVFGWADMKSVCFCLFFVFCFFGCTVQHVGS